MFSVFRWRRRIFPLIASSTEGGEHKTLVGHQHSGHGQFSLILFLKYCSRCDQQLWKMSLLLFWGAKNRSYGENTNRSTSSLLLGLKYILSPTWIPRDATRSIAIAEQN